MNPPRQAQLIQFLQTDLEVPIAAVALALRQCARFPEELPMTLFQYGLITIDQLAQIFDWLGTA
jgi:Protein of unknown function (DUF2949)